MMGERTVAQEALFYEFSLERHVPAHHLLRAIDRFVDLSGIRAHLRPFYSDTGRPSFDPELMIRVQIVGYCFGIRSERRLCDASDRAEPGWDQILYVNLQRRLLRMNEHFGLANQPCAVFGLPHFRLRRPQAVAGL